MVPPAFAASLHGSILVSPFLFASYVFLLYCMWFLTMHSLWRHLRKHCHVHRSESEFAVKQWYIKILLPQLPGFAFMRFVSVSVQEY